MPARKAGGKYKGKIPRVKGEATLQAELEAKRRKAQEAQLARLQERRQAEEMAKRGLQSAEQEAEEAKRQRIMMMFGGGGKAGKIKKFFKLWKIGMIQIKKDKAIKERNECWRRSCDHCGELENTALVGPKDGTIADPLTCAKWWKSALKRDPYAELGILDVAPLDPRPVFVEQRTCQCCGIDTGLKAAGCRAWSRLRDTKFEMPFDAQLRRNREAAEDMSPVSPDASFLGAGFVTPRSEAPEPAPKCKLCTKFMKWSAHDSDHYKSGWRCDNYHSCRHTHESMGKARWHCRGCQRDQCHNCQPKEMFSSFRKRRSRASSWAASIPPPSPSGSVTPSNASDGTRRGALGLPTSPLPPAALSVDSPRTLGRAASATLLPRLLPEPPARGEDGNMLLEASHWSTGKKTLLDKFSMRMWHVDAGVV